MNQQENGDLLINNVRAVPTDYVFIIEKSSNLVPVSRNEYVFEGICARFGVMNGNNRLYIKEDYLPHLSYLNDKIAAHRLVGELDHPQAFDISLKNISHIVEKLWYDESDNTVKIRIRLLNTPHGNIARALVDAGVPLAISSRSAGQIMEGHKVRLHRIFTFDLVAEPGFADAILQPSLSENLKQNYSMLFESLDKIKAESIVNNLTPLTESYNFGDTVRIYKINDSDKKFLELLTLEEKSKENNTSPMENAVSREEFNAYSEKLTSEIAAMKKGFAETAQALTEFRAKLFENQPPAQAQQAQAGQAQMTQPPQGGEGQAQAQAQTTELPNVQEDDSNKDVMSKLIQYVDFMALQLQNVMNHTNYVTEMLNRSIAYSEGIGGVLNKHVNHTNYMAKKLNEAINFMDVVGQKTNEAINFANYLSNVTNDLANYADLLGIRTNEAINFANYLSDVSEMQIKHTNYISNTLENRIASQPVAPSIEGRNLENNVASLTESTTNLNEEIKKVVTKITENSQDAVLEQRHPFLKLMNEEQKKFFYNLDQQTKHDVVLALESSVYTSNADVITIMNGVIAHKNAQVPNYIKFMPDKYKAIYENMNDAEKNAVSVRANSGVYKLNTPYQVKSFWDSQNFDGVQQRIAENEQNAKLAQNAQAINESQSKEGFIPVSQVQQMSRGYSDDYVASIKRHAARQ